MWKSVYFAFINNGTLVYICDKNGNSIDQYAQWIYIGVRKGHYTYQPKPIDMSSFLPPMENKMYGYLYANDDFSRINLIWMNCTWVFEECDPADLEAPDVFY